MVGMNNLKLVLFLADALKCFQCHSSQPGCGVKKVDYILQGWKDCPGTETDPPMCVKILNTVGSKLNFSVDLYYTKAHRLAPPS